MRNKLVLLTEAGGAFHYVGSKTAMFDGVTVMSYRRIDTGVRASISSARNAIANYLLCRQTYQPRLSTRAYLLPTVQKMLVTPAAGYPMGLSNCKQWFESAAIGHPKDDRASSDAKSSAVKIAAQLTINGRFALYIRTQGGVR